jgi:hypothetical protein
MERFCIKLRFSYSTNNSPEQGVNEPTQIRNELGIFFISINLKFCLLLAHNPKPVVSRVGALLAKLCYITCSRTLWDFVETKNCFLS